MERQRKYTSFALSPSFSDIPAKLLLFSSPPKLALPCFTGLAEQEGDKYGKQISKSAYEKVWRYRE